MAFSENRLLTRAECVTYRDRKLAERTALLARQSAVNSQLTLWDASGDPVAKLAATQLSVATMTPLVATLEDGTAKRRIENMLNSLKSSANNLTTLAEKHGADDLLDREQARDEIAAELVILDQLIAAVQARHDALPV